MMSLSRSMSSPRTILHAEAKTDGTAWACASTSPSQNTVDMVSAAPGTGH